MAAEIAPAAPPNLGSMIQAMHTLIYSDDAAATRAFFKDVLHWKFTEDDESGEDWPIFRTGPSELGVHPTRGEWDGEEYSSPRHHSVSLMCDDLEATVEDLRGRGAEFNGDAQDMGFGTGIMLRVPGADDILLYQPRHPTAYDL